MRTLVTLLLVFAAAGAGAETHPATRIVSLAPNMTELLFTAGAGDRIVATVEFSDYPAAAKTLPRIGDAFRVDYERVLALKPDLIIAWQDGTPPTIIDELRRLHQPVRALRIAGLDDVASALRTLGEWAGTGATADREAADYLARLATFHSQHKSRTALSVFFEISEAPLYTVNDRHPISEIIRLCGGTNLFADLSQLAPAVGVESVLARNPDVILVADDVPGAFDYWQRWKQLTAVREQNLFTVSSDRTSRTTVRILEGAEQVCALLDKVRERRASTAH